MILVMDIGNTNIVFGVYEKEKLLFNWRMGTDKDKTSDEFGIFIVNVLKYENIDIKKIEAVIIASVAPPIMYSLSHAIRKYFNLNPLIIGENVKIGIKIKYDNPNEVGADRIVNAVAAYEIYGGPLIVVDFGTATTFCVITSRGEYLGGAICPGIKISADALFRSTSKLPKIEIVKPENVIGKNTVDNIRIGLVYGYVGQVDYLVLKMKEELMENNIKVIATGGLARLIAGESKVIDEINSHLTLEGLRIMYEKNKQA